MRRKLNTTLGFYSPSFMRMHVGTTKSLRDLNNVNDDYSESVFIHEYIHFIQDLTTNYGLANIISIVDYMKFVNNHLKTTPPGAFDTPVQPIVSAVDNVYINYKLYDVYNGSGDENYATLKRARIVSKKMRLPIGERLVETIEVTYDDETGRAGKFEFGALCIIESMAFIIESCCYPNCEPSPQLPYHSAELLAQLIYPAFAENRLNVLALCDASLKTLHPGPLFYKTLVRAKENKKTFSTPYEVYAYCVETHPPFIHNGCSDFDTLFVRNSELAISQLKDYFNDTSFDKLKNWIEHIFSASFEIRTRYPFFPVDIANGGKISSNGAFKAFFCTVGTPLITNNVNETILHDPMQVNDTANYPVMWAIEQIHNIFWGLQRNCEMVGLCQSSGIHTDLRCGNAPWERTQDRDKGPCPLSIMWRHWALGDYFPR